MLQLEVLRSINQEAVRQSSSTLNNL